MYLSGDCTADKNLRYIKDSVSCAIIITMGNILGCEACIVGMHSIGAGKMHYNYKHLDSEK